MSSVAGSEMTPIDEQRNELRIRRVSRMKRIRNTPFDFGEVKIAPPLDRLGRHLASVRIRVIQRIRDFLVGREEMRGHR